MRSGLRPLATRLVRAWTRLYTHGLPRAERAARRAEIDSDLWEFEHDPAAPQGGWGATQVLARLLIGIPDDLAWRMDVGAKAHRAPVRALAAAGMMMGPRRVSAFGLSATIHVVAVTAVMWLALRGPVPSPTPGEAAPGQAGIEHHRRPNASLWNQPVRHERHNESGMKMPVQSDATPGKPRAFGVVRAVAVAMAVRVGLITPPRLVPQAPSPAAGLLSGSPLSAQTGQPSSSPDRFIAKVLQSRYSLSVRNGQLSGTGAQVLQSAIAQSRFVLLGDDHGLAQAPELWAAVCNAAGPERFQTMAIEEGPLAAAELERWARRRDGLAQLAAFERAFPESITVYNSREEFEMLQQCARAAQSEFHLWGLNQEAAGAGGLILSRVLASRVGKEARPAMQQLLQKNDEAYRKAVQSGRIFDLFVIAADDKELARGAALLQKDGSPEAQSLFRSLVESHEIHRTSPADYGNARRRERLMKTLFADNYTRAASTAAAPPKVLLKFGAYHVYRGLNPVHGSGIGNYVAEFAEGQGAQSLHIRLMAVKGSQPVHPRVGQPAQLRRFNRDVEPAARYLQAMFSHLLRSDWTMFDLRPLRQDVNAPGGAMTPDLATLVFGYDILVIVPEGTPSTEIRPSGTFHHGL
jgi:hypothetical protein